MPPIPAAPLLLADWTEAIGFVLVLVFAVMRFLLSEMGGGKKAQPKPPPAKRPPPNPQQQELRSEVEEFLRTARGLPPRKPTPEAGPASRAGARRAAAEESPYVGESVGEHVKRHVSHLEEPQLAENAARLGEDLAQTDERLEARLQATFDHSLGRIKRREAPPPPVEVDAAGEALGADELAVMLGTPQGIRNAIVLNEILQRPVDRW